MRHPALRVHLALLFVQATFGAFHVVGKAVLAHLDPLALAGLRVLLATPLLLALAWRVDRVLPARRHLPRIALLGLTGVFGNQLLYILGLARTTAANAGILMPSIPVFAAVIAAATGVERLTRRRAAGVLCAVVAAIVMLDPTRLTFGQGVGLGNLLVLGNCLSFAIYLVLQRPLLKELPPLTVVAWAFVMGGCGVALVAVPSLSATPFAELPGVIWIGIAYVVLVPTALNYALNTWAVARSSPALVATYTVVQPVSSIVLGAVFLGEALTGRELAGFIGIAAGLAAVGGAAAPRDRAPA